MKYLLFIAGFLAATISFGCKSSNPVSGSTQTGDLTGKVALVDLSQNGLKDRSGVTVLIEGTQFSTISDTGGNWTIKNLPNSTYSISFSKPGFSTWKNTSFEFVGGGLTWFGDFFPSNGSTVTLLQIPTFTITFDSIQLAGTRYLQQYDSIAVTLKYDTLSRDSIVFGGRDTTHHIAYRTVTNTQGTVFGHVASAANDPNHHARVLIAKTPSPDILDPSSYLAYYDIPLTSQSGGKSPNDFTISISDIFNATALAPGQSAYVIAYPINAGGVGSYFDVSARKTVFSGYGASSNILKLTY